MKFLLAVLFGMPLAAAVILRAFGGDPFATSIAAGFVALFVLQHIAARTATRPAPRKADPAKIARLERELGVGPEPEPPKPPDGSVTWRDGKPGIVQGDDWYPVVANVVDTEATDRLPDYANAHGYTAMVEHLVDLGVMARPDSGTPIGTVTDRMREACKAWMAKHP